MKGKDFLRKILVAHQGNYMLDFPKKILAAPQGNYNVRPSLKDLVALMGYAKLAMTNYRLRDLVSPRVGLLPKNHA